LEITETFTQKIYGQNAFKMFDVLRNKINFVEPIAGLKVTIITDGRSGKYVLPNEQYGFLPDELKGDFYQFRLEDDSLVRISVDEANNSLIFNFVTAKDKHIGLRETVLNLIDYDYDRKLESKG
jgi:hypothetical protein